MKKLILVLSLFIYPALGFSQTKVDYMNAMQKFVNFYNAGQSDSICRMLIDHENYGLCVFTPASLQSSLANYGEIKSFEYFIVDTITDRNRITLFKVTATKAKFILGFDMVNKNRFGTFRFDTDSDYITSLLKK